MADLVLPRGKVKVLQAEDKDYKRGLLVELLKDGGYKMAYWFNEPDKPYPIEILVDGKSITKDGKVVTMKFHPKDYYDKMQEGWSDKYKKSIDCNNPKGFSQKAHCAGKNKRESVMKLEELVGKPITEAQFDEAAGKKDACYHKVKARYDVWPSAYASGALVKCRKVGAANWGNKSKKEGLGDRMSKKLKKLKGVNLKKKKIKLKAKSGRGKISHLGMEGFASNAQRRAAFASGYKAKGKKKKNEDVFFESTTENGMTTNHIYYEEDGKGYGYTLEFINDLNEAEYQGRKVKLGKIMQGDAKKFKVYVKNPKGNVVKVNFGQGGKAKGGTMKIRKSNPKARANFRARHNCDNPGPRHKARYWSCRKW